MKHAVMALALILALASCGRKTPLTQPPGTLFEGATLAQGEVQSEDEDEIFVDYYGDETTDDN